MKVTDVGYRARLKALRILSFGDNSKRQLFRKLVESGIERSVAADTVRQMVELGYINERRQLEAFIEKAVNERAQGPGKITGALVAKGYNASDIEEVISELSRDGKISFTDAAARLIERKLPQDADKESIDKLLYKNGFSV